MPPKKILATMGIGRHQEMLNVTLPSFENFASLHGYEVRYPTSDPAPDRAGTPWGKIAFINELLPTCETLFWIDADAAIVDRAVDISDDLLPSKSLGVVEHKYDGQFVPNAGVMVIRSNRWSQKFFHEIWGQTRYISSHWTDNAALLDLFGYEFDPLAAPMYCRPGRPTKWLRRTQFLGNEWNSIPQDMAVHQRIVHFTGTYPFDERIERLREALAGSRS